MTFPGSEDLVVTQASLEDWSVVAGWAGDEGWNPGLSDAPSFFAQDPEGFFIGRIGAEPVSAVSVVTYDADYAFLGFYLVRPDLRGRGYGLTTWKTALAHAGGRTVGLDGVVAQQDNYRRSGFEPVHRTVRFTGTVPTAPAARGSAARRGGRPRGHRGLRQRLLPGRPRPFPHTVAGRTGPPHLRPCRGRKAHRLRGRPARPRPSARRPAVRRHPRGRTGPAARAGGGDPRACDHRRRAADEHGGRGPGRGVRPHPSFETARMYTGPVRPFARERVYGITTLELG